MFNGLFLFKHENVFYRLRKGDPFLKLFQCVALTVPEKNAKTSRGSLAPPTLGRAPAISLS
jgi:hypothetical protein